MEKLIGSNDKKYKENWRGFFSIIFLKSLQFFIFCTRKKIKTANIYCNNKHTQWPKIGKKCHLGKLHFLPQRCFFLILELSCPWREISQNVDFSLWSNHANSHTYSVHTLCCTIFPFLPFSEAPGSKPSVYLKNKIENDKVDWFICKYESKAVIFSHLWSIIIGFLKAKYQICSNKYVPSKF